MPSDLAKKKAAKKKEAAKARQRTKKTDENEEGEQPETQINGAESNGERTDLLCLVSFLRSVLALAWLVHFACSFITLELAILSNRFMSSIKCKQNGEHDFVFVGVAYLTKELDEFELAKTEARAVTGVLASHPNSTDVHISSLSLTFHGQELLADTSLELNSGRRYGLIGLNGTGNMSLLARDITSQ